MLIGKFKTCFPRVLITAAKAKRKKRVTSMTKRARIWTNRGVCTRFALKRFTSVERRGSHGYLDFPLFRSRLEFGRTRIYKSRHYVEAMINRGT